jgi:hypothetical protein
MGCDLLPLVELRPIRKVWLSLLNEIEIDQLNHRVGACPVLILPLFCST